MSFPSGNSKVKFELLFVVCFILLVFFERRVGFVGGFLKEGEGGFFLLFSV